jgi:hypothetical protein
MEDILHNVTGGGGHSHHAVMTTQTEKKSLRYCITFHTFPLVQQPEEMILCTFTEMDQVFFSSASAQQLHVLVVVSESNEERISNDEECTLLLQQGTIHDGNHTFPCLSFDLPLKLFGEI